MKTMILTGIGSEQSFKNGGGNRYFLVFNEDIRIPVPEETAEAVVKEMYGEDPPQEEQEIQEEQFEENPGADYTYHSQTSDEDTDDGVDQI